MISKNGLMHFSAEDGPQVQAEGTSMRKASPTWVTCIEYPFVVETNEGPLNGEAGDYLAYDEKSGHVWPVSAAYVAMNYVPNDGPVPTPATATPTPATHELYAAFEALQAAARHLSATDVANAEVNLAEVRYRPLTQLCGEAAAGLREYLEEQVGLVTDANVGLGHDAPVTALRVGADPFG